MSIVVNNMADRGATPYFGYEAWKIRDFSEANIHCTNFVGFAAERELRPPHSTGMSPM